jgi:predicted nuclease of restriction endonuclease-like (RecB) superfamily
VALEVDGQTFYIDLLFYHLRLHCYFVIELKNGAFKPEYAGYGKPDVMKSAA